MSLLTGLVKPYSHILKGFCISSRMGYLLPSIFDLKKIQMDLGRGLPSLARKWKLAVDLTLGWQARPDRDVARETATRDGWAIGAKEN